MKDHIHDLSLVFDRLLKYGIKVKGPKIRLGVKELPFLGTIVGVNGCRPDPEKTKAIRMCATCGDFSRKMRS